MSRAPGTDSGDGFGTVVVIPVLRLRQPLRLARPLARRLAGSRRAI